MVRPRNQGKPSLSFNKQISMRLAFALKFPIANRRNPTDAAGPTPTHLTPFLPGGRKGENNYYKG